MTATQRTETPRRDRTSGGTSALDELKAAYNAQLAQLASERDEARRQARRAKNEAAVARADLASVKADVHRLLAAAAKHLPGLETPAAIEAPAAQERALPAARQDRALPEARREARQERALPGARPRRALPEGLSEPARPEARQEPDPKSSDRRNAHGKPGKRRVRAA